MAKFARKEEVVEDDAPKALAYDPNASSIPFHNAKEEVKVLWGPVGSGKSSSAAWEFILQCMESPIPVRGVVVRESYRELMDSTKATFMEWFGSITEWREADKIAVVTLPGPGGKPQRHELYFRSAQRPEDVQKFMSTEFSFAWLEECVPAYQQSGTMGAGLPRAVFDMINMRLRQKGAHRYTIVCTFNPPTPAHWTYLEFIKPSALELQKKGYSVTWQPPRENEKNLREGYYDNITRRLDDDQKRRFVDGEVVNFYPGERVFPEARDHWNVIDDLIEPIPGVELVLGFDFGLTPCTLITQITPGGQWRWLRELQSFNAAMDSHSEHLRSLLKEYYPGWSYRSWADPAGNNREQSDGRTCYSLLSERGFPVNAGLKDWQSRKEAIKQRLERTVNGRPALIVSRTGCPMASEALLGAYRYPKSRDGIIGHDPIKNDYSHLMDAAQYIATMEFKISPEAAKLRAEQEAAARAGHLPRLDPFRRTPERRTGGWMTH